MAYVEADSKSVLVVTVEPPQPGDRMRTLNKEADRYRRGAVFVRRPGRTIPAEPQDIRALEDRFAAPLLEVRRDRRRERLEKISEALDAVFDAVRDAQPDDRLHVRWTTPRNRLADLLAGWDGPKMPMLERVVAAGSAFQAKIGYAAARSGIDEQLRRLGQEK